MFSDFKATSQLDESTERRVMANIREQRRGRTTVIIAYRLSTITEADQIVILDGGRVVEQGTHADLLVRRGLYSQLWQEQITPYNWTDEVELAEEPVQSSPTRLTPTAPPLAIGRRLWGLARPHRGIQSCWRFYSVC